MTIFGHVFFGTNSRAKLCAEFTGRIPSNLICFALWLARPEVCFVVVWCVVVWCGVVWYESRGVRLRIEGRGSEDRSGTRRCGEGEEGDVQTERDVGRRYSDVGGGESRRRPSYY